MSDFTKYRLPLFLWMLLIFISSSIPSQEWPDVGWWGWAKVVHLIYFGTLCFLTWRATCNQQRFPLLAHYPRVTAIVTTMLYGASDEFHQLFTPGRHAQVSDVMIDTFGGLLFLAGLSIYLLRTKQAPGSAAS
jgi:VanZ family protein